MLSLVDEVPFVPLEEAVKPLKSLLPGIEKCVNFVKYDMQSPKDGLTRDESAAIILYGIEAQETSVFHVVNQVSKQYRPDSHGVWWDFSSTTRKTQAMGAFLSSTTNTLFSIECRNGKDIRNHSMYPEEDEVLLLPGFHFEIVSVLKMGPGGHLVHLKEIDPPE